MAESTVDFELTLARNLVRMKLSSTQIIPMQLTYCAPMIIKTASVTPKCLHDDCSTYLKVNGDGLGIDLSSNLNCSCVDAGTLARERWRRQPIKLTKNKKMEKRTYLRGGYKLHCTR